VEYFRPTDAGAPYLARFWPDVGNTQIFPSELLAPIVEPSRMKSRSKLSGRLPLSLFELAIKVGEVSVTHLVSNQGNGPFRIKQQSASVTDPELRHITRGRHPRLLAKQPVQ
jgi:hypothetical protein